MIGTASVAYSARFVELRSFAAASTPYCQASFNLETLVVLICVRGEYRFPVGSWPYAGQSVWQKMAGAAFITNMRIAGDRIFAPSPLNAGSEKVYTSGDPCSPDSVPSPARR